MKYQAEPCELKASCAPDANNTSRNLGKDTNGLHCSTNFIRTYVYDGNAWSLHRAYLGRSSGLALLRGKFKKAV